MTSPFKGGVCGVGRGDLEPLCGCQGIGWELGKWGRCCAQIFLNPAGGPQSVKLGLVRVGGATVAAGKAVLKPSVAETVW